MCSSRLFLVSSCRNFIAAALLLGALTITASADAPKSLAPAFGTDGAEFSIKSRDGNTVRGWLPKDWNDNTEWAPVTATYTKLTDSPDKDAGAVRIKTEKVEEGGQLQLTTYQGIQKYKKGTSYVVTGWVRSADRTGITVGIRANKEPYDFFHQMDLPTDGDWKKFEFAFTPSSEIEGLLMFVVRDVGSVDLAGVALVQKP